MGTKSERYFFFHSFMRSLYVFIFLASGLVESFYIIALLKTREKFRKIATLGQAKVFSLLTNELH